MKDVKNVTLRLNSQLAMAGCGYTKEGQPLIIFNPNFFRKTPRDIIEAIYFHELGHLRFKHKGGNRKIIQEIVADIYSAKGVGCDKTIKAINHSLYLSQNRKVIKEFKIRKFILNLVKYFVL